MSNDFAYHAICKSVCAGRGKIAEKKSTVKIHVCLALKLKAAERKQDSRQMDEAMVANMI